MRDERRLARRAARGDRDAFTTIFRRFQQDLYRYCVGILGNPEDAQDALQNTMLKALGALPGERREIDLKPWLYRIAHNESIDLIRRRRQTVSLEDDGLASTAGLADAVETRHRLRQLLADVAELPERQRGALLMREAGGLDFEEIAAALGTSAAVARQTLYEARLGLREMDAGRNMECTAVTKALSDGDRRTRRRRDISAHLKACSECRQFAAEIDSRRRVLASISPLPALAAAALLKGVAGGGSSGAALGSTATATSGTSAGAGAGAAGAAAGKAIGTATLLKSAATIAAVAAIGVGGADVGGLLHGAGHGGPPKARAQAQAPAGQEDEPPLQTAGPASAGRAVRDRTSLRRSRSGRLDQVAGRPRPVDARPRLAPASSSSATATVRTAGPPALPAAAGTPAPVGADETTAAAAPQQPQVERPHGPDHPKELPASAAHGQETAAAAGNEKGESASAPGHSGKSADTSSPAAADHPTHPEHPAKPDHPDAAEPAPASSPPPTTVPEGGESAPPAETAAGEEDARAARSAPPGKPEGGA